VTVTIDIDDAAVGRWQYTITAVRILNENFRFTLNIEEKR